MKRVLLIICTFFFSSIIFSQARHWVGPALGGLWSDAGNWATFSGGPGGASPPATSNDAIFDNGFNGVVEMDMLPATTPFTFTINSLLITDNSTVTLQRTQAGGGARIFQLASTDAVTHGLKIDNGSTLIIDAVNTTIGSLVYTLALTGGAGVTGEISGNLYLKGTGVAGTCDAEIVLQYDATHYAALVVKNLGVIKYFDNTGNTSPVTGSFLTMEDGSTYEIEKEGGSFPPGVWSANSLAKVHNTAGPNPPFFYGTTYGNLEWNCPFQNNYSLTGDISFNNVKFINTNIGSDNAFRVTNSVNGIHTLTINGLLEVSATSILEITGPGVAMDGGRIHLKGDLINNGIIRTSGVAGTVNVFELNGSSNQVIVNPGTFSGTALDFIMNNPNGATLLNSVTLPGNLTLTDGKIKTTFANILTMVDDATYTGGSAASFIEGPMEKIGDDNFSFPVGVGSIYAPIGIQRLAGETPTDVFIAEYIRANPQSTFSGTYQPGIDHISYVEYWTLDANTALATKLISLDVHPESFCRDLLQTYVTRLVGSAWQKEGGFPASGPTPGFYETGTLKTTNQISDFSPGVFTLGTDLSFDDNPLPIRLISFDATKLTAEKASINWELAACCSSAVRFEIQRAGADKSFVTIGTANGSETSKFYNYTDHGLKNGINYYRLKMTDEDRKITYSRTVAIINGVNGLLLTSLMPTMVTTSAMLTVSSSKDRKLDLVIVDMQGRVVQKQNHTVASGNTNIQISTGGMAAGVYQLIGISAEGKTNVIRFIKK